MAAEPIDSQTMRGLRVVDADPSPDPSPDQHLPRAHGALVALVHLALAFQDARAVYWLQRLAPFGKRAISDEHLMVTAQIVAERASAGLETDTLILLDELQRRGRCGQDDPLSCYAPTDADVIGETLSAELLSADAYAQEIVSTAKSRALYELAKDAAGIALRNAPGEVDTYAAQVTNTLRGYDDLLSDATGGSPFKPYTLSELLAVTRPAVIDPVMRLKEHALAVVYAQPNIGKSAYVVWRLCAHASAGRNVVYITGEGQYEIGWRMMAAIIAHDLDAEMVQQHMRVIKHAPKLLDAAEVAAVRAQIGDAFDNDEPIAIIALDTLTTGLTGQNQNAQEVITAAIDAMKDLIEVFGAAGILTHHSGKDISKGESGSIHIRASVDLSIELTREDGSDVMVAQCRKARDGDKEWREAYSIVAQALDERADNISVTVMPGAEMPASAGASMKRSATRGPNPSDRKMIDVLASLACGMRFGAWVAQAWEMHQIPQATAARAIKRLSAPGGAVYKDDDGLYRVVEHP